MVRGQHGNWHCCNLASQPALQWPLAAVFILYHLCTERHPLRYIPYDLDSEVHPLSRNLGGYDPAPGTEPIPGYVPDGSGDDHQHDSVRLRSRVGWRLVEAGLGALVVRCRRCACNLLHFAFCNVRVCKISYL